MKNADKPTYPLEFKKEGSYNTEGWSNGLTKREYFAGLAMQGLLASNSEQTAKYIVKKAIESTDELLKQLENK